MGRSDRHTYLYRLISLMIPVLILSSCGSSRRTVTTRVQGTADQVVTMAYTNDIGRQLVKEAQRWLGAPYLFGGHERSGADCSGLVREVYNRTLGIALPRSSADQRTFATDIRRDALRHGDLIFFAPGGHGRISHVGIYIGDNRMIHASSSKGVIVSDINDAYWQRNYVSSGRILREAAKGGNAPGNPRKTDPLYDPPTGTLPPVAAPADLRSNTEPDYRILDDILSHKLDSVSTNYLD